MPAEANTLQFLRDKQVKVRVPASTANLGSGFDAIGVAFQLYTELTLEENDKLEFLWADKGGDIKPFPFVPEENLILKAMKRVASEIGAPLPNLEVIVQSDIPFTRGLGSSAAAYVAGLFAMNEWLKGGLSKDQLLWIAAEEEGHPDNVGASIFGGFFIGAIDWEARRVHYNALKFPEKWTWLAAIPSYTLSTSKARHLLPSTYSKQDALFNLSRYGLLTSSLLTENEQGVILGLNDRLHQPYRQHLIPGFEDLCQKREQLQALGFVISGAGPTVLGLFGRGADLSYAKQQMEQSLSKSGEVVRVEQLMVDQIGAHIE
ncbi:homoserine kinase [Bacillus horti]|uniref:Homoserine kinase n=2 Tax=Caldalkalibacillus horti TaxID=77523 RepID=A0ABT9VTF0_9BACI|nr:homoserine kinase [Bacillus horti]MDQ0164263.1 homoserine kinase [Bacillus horti]